MLQVMAGGASSDGPPFARNYVELAEALKVTRQSLGSWRKYDDAPKPAANGLHDVAQWRECVARSRPPA
jgi:hypothetical protein